MVSVIVCLITAAGLGDIRFSIRRSVRAVIHMECDQKVHVVRAHVVGSLFTICPCQNFWHESTKDDRPNARVPQFPEQCHHGSLR